MSDQTSRTTQLRRYEIVEGELDAFVDWWQQRLAPARRACGFEIEFAYALPESNEFVWAVSTSGDAVAFGEIEAAYLVSDERAAAFDGTPQRTTSQNVTLVRAVI